MWTLEPQIHQVDLPKCFSSAFLDVQVASAAEVPVADLWTQLQKKNNWEALLSDGLHLSPLGNQAVFAEVKRVLIAELPSIAPELLPLDLPLHGDLTHETAADVLASYVPPQ